MHSFLKGIFSNLGPAPWSMEKSQKRNPVVSLPAVILVAAILASPTASINGALFATAAKVPQVRNPNMKMSTAMSFGKSSTTTTKMRFTSEISDQACEDSKDFLFKGNAKKDCKWAMKRPGKKCKKKDKETGILVADACRSACDHRCTCRNVKKAFKFNGKSTRCGKIKRSDCSSVAEDGHILADLCPKKCRDCYKHHSGPPTGAPGPGWTQVGSDIDGEAMSDLSGLYSVSMSSDGTIVAIGAVGNADNGSYSGHVRVFEYASGEWIQLGSDIDGDAMLDFSGASVSFSENGTRLAVGAPLNNGVNGANSGHVRVYEYVNSEWQQLGKEIDGEAENDNSGYSVSISSDGTIVAIGAFQNYNGNGDKAGHARVYGYNGSTWEQLGADIEGEIDGGDFGMFVSLSSDGTRVAIAAPSSSTPTDPDIGLVRVFEIDSASDAWQQLGQDIVGETALDGSGSGISMASDGTRVAIASPNSNKSMGHVRVFQYDIPSDGWQQLGADIDGEAEDDAPTGVSMSSDGTRVAIGAGNNDGVNGIDSGHVRVFEYTSPDGWTQLGYDIDGEGEGDLAGNSVSMSSDGKRVAIGAGTNDGVNGINSGHVRVYELRQL